MIYKKTLVSSELVLFALALSFLVEIFTCTGGTGDFVATNVDKSK